MSDIVRISAHPTDPEVVLLHVPHGSNEAMGRFEPAQLDVDLRAYLLHIDHLDSFERFASYGGLYVLDERAMTPTQVTRAELCDICNKPEKVCQTSAGNRGALRDHDFVSLAQAAAKRTQRTR